jgi:hypothetical protein
MVFKPSTTSLFSAITFNVNWTLPYGFLTVMFNVTLSTAIVVRLIVHRCHLAKVLGKGHGTEYTQIAAIIIESCAVYTITALALLVPFALHNPIGVLFVQFGAQTAILAPLLIIYRIAQGKAMTRETTTSTTEQNRTSTGYTSSKTFGGTGYTQCSYSTPKTAAFPRLSPGSGGFESRSATPRSELDEKVADAGVDSGLTAYNRV